MSTFPLISHRMFLAAIGQKYPPAHPLRGSEGRRPAETPARETPLEVVRQFVPEQKPRLLPMALVGAEA